MASDPYPKTRQLARGERRYHRKVATPKEWAAFRAEKLTCCRICAQYGGELFHHTAPLELHHLVSRAHGGDDVADNLVGLCRDHHDVVTQRSSRPSLALLAACLTGAERAYVEGKLGPGAMFRLFGAA